MSILSEMIEKYSQCSTYSDTGSIVTEKKELFPLTHLDQGIHFRTLFVRPGKLIFEYRGDIIWTNGEVTYTHREQKAQRESSLSSAFLQFIRDGIHPALVLLAPQYQFLGYELFLNSFECASEDETSCTLASYCKPICAVELRIRKSDLSLDLLKIDLTNLRTIEYRYDTCKFDEELSPELFSFPTAKRF